jgi:excisionase family DNA binding protein
VTIFNAESPPPRFVGVQDVADVTGLSRSTVYALLDDGTIRSVRLGGRRLIPTEARDAFVAELMAQAR